MDPLWAAEDAWGSTELDDVDAKVSGLETGGGELAEHVERWDLLQEILNTGNICKDVK